MKIIRNPYNCPEFAKGLVVALGNFDGLHKGHQKIILGAKSLAQALKINSAILTFEPHPAKVLGNLALHERITPFQHKARMAREFGVDILFVIPFTKKFAANSAEDFAEKILVQSLRAKHVIAGEDFTFGKNRAGNAALLQKIGKKYGIDVTIMKIEGVNDRKYSSSQIKQAVKEGNIEEANSALGRPFSIMGRVIKGEKRGRLIGFPTANISLKSYVRPKFGVYSVEIEIHGKKYNGVANIGIKPTFAGTKEVLEVNIFGFDEEIYDKKIIINFYSFIRREKKFSGMDELKTQIKKDAETAKIFFERNHP